MTLAIRFLIDTYGRELLNGGSGVLDIAGGKGELSFELVNLNDINATVVEPRALQLWRQHKWMLVGPLPAAAHTDRMAAGEQQIAMVRR